MPDLAALFQQHKTPVLAGGAAVAVGAGVIARRRSAANPARNAATTTNPQAGTYDSTLSDLYNQFQPQLDNLEAQIAKVTPPPATVTDGIPTSAQKAPFVKLLFAQRAQALLPQVDSKSSPLSQALAAPFIQLGKITGAGGQFFGQSVVKGAPVYAQVGGQWVQSFDIHNLPTGTIIGTPSQFAGYVTPGSQQEQY